MRLTLTLLQKDIVFNTLKQCDKANDYKEVSNHENILLPNNSTWMDSVWIIQQIHECCYSTRNLRVILIKLIKIIEEPPSRN